MAGHASHGVQEGYAEITDPDEDEEMGLKGSLVGAPTSQWLLMGNGAESRLTLKYFPVG